MAGETVEGAERGRKATLLDVAARAQVAPSIVSRLLNGDVTLKIRPATRSRILAAVADLGYSPNSAGRALRMSKTGAIALLVPDVTNPIYSELRKGAELAAREAGYLILIGNADEFEQRESVYSRLVGERRIDGVLVQRSSFIDDETFRRVVAADLPTILINSAFDGISGSLILDDEEGMKVAVRHLVALGHREIALLAGPLTLDWAVRRRAGFEAALREAAIPLRDGRVVEGGYTIEAGWAGMRRLLEAPNRPTAVAVANVIAAIGALAAAREIGVNVPAALSVVAFHDTWFAAHVSPPLTTVKMPMHELGVRAVNLLLERMEGAPPVNERLTYPPPQLVLRMSTAPPARLGS